MTLQEPESSLITPLLDKDSSDVDLPWSYCGNFIIALEDEFRIVRLAAVQAMCVFSLASLRFANCALSFFVDSFQDENNKVQVASFAALKEIYQRHQLVVPASHLEAILSHLDDNEPETRKVVCDLLAVVGVHDLEGLLRLVRCVPLALNKYPQEGPIFVRMLLAFGNRNSQLVSQAAPRLLKIDKFFLNPEPKIEDAGYLVRLVVILAALGVLPEMEHALPDYVFRHYHYLRAKYPKEMPNYWGCRFHSRLFATPASSVVVTIGKETWSSIFERLRRIINLQRQGAQYKDALECLKLNLLFQEEKDLLTRTWCRFLLRIVDGIQDSPDFQVHSLLLAFEGPEASFLNNLLLYFQGDLSHPPPRVETITLRELSVTFDAFSHGTEKSPLKSMRLAPLLFPIKGRLNYRTLCHLGLSVAIPGQKEEYWEEMVVNSELMVSCNLKLFPKLLAHLELGKHRLYLTVKVLHQSCGLACHIGGPAFLWIDLIPSPE